MANRRSKRRPALLEKERAVRKIDAELFAIEGQLDALASIDPSGPEVQNLHQRRSQLQAARKRNRDEAKAERSQVEAEESGETVPIAEPPSLDRDLPILLFPVRLETRYLPREGSGDNAAPEYDLCIRIYPDELHVNSHEAGLTPEEIEWGQHFWNQVWKWANNKQRTTTAWEQLVRRLGGKRAAWVASALRPNGFNPEMLLKAWSGKPAPFDFPDVETRGMAWTEPAMAGMLPDWWAAWIFREGQPTIRERSRLVQLDLAVGPDPVALGEPDPDPLLVDEGMRWMIDFNAALEAGMAIRVPMNSRQKIDKLIVFGMRGGEPADLAQELEEHFTALRFGQGLDFVRQGTPTNNTDATRAGWEPQEDDDDSYAAMIRELGPLPQIEGYENSHLLANALWLTDEAFARLPHGHETEQLDAKMMNELLWSTSWGHYLESMIGSQIMSPSLLGWIRDHWADYVRGRGPYPAIRVGGQPYGILPVMVGEEDLDPAWPYDPEVPLAIIVNAARAIWNASTENVTQLRLNSPDSDSDLVQALATLAHPQRFSVRGVVERAKLQTISNQANPWNGWQFQLNGANALLNQTLSGFGGSGPARLSNTLYSSGSREWVNDLVTSEPLSATELLAGNYLDWMATSQVGDLPNEVHNHSTDTLLYLLALHSGNLEDGGITGGDPTRWRAAAEHLATLPTATLDLLLRETLGLCGYRHDAWETSLATRQLEKLHQRVAARMDGSAGIQIGGYGWVENLYPRGPLGDIVDGDPVGNDPEEGNPEEGELKVDPRNRGYVHAPTMQHGVTASVLRSAWFSHGGGADTPMAVNLSSARARDASDLIDGVRNGLGLGELLGYRFERGLHEGHPGVELDQYINDFRELAPLVANKQMSTEDPSAAPADLAAPLVVDGLRLLQLWRTGDASLTATLSTLDAAAEAAIEAELNGMEEAVDAFADAAMAEGVHHVLQGNQLRAGAITDAVTSGEVAPPELEVTGSPRTGRGVTHRLLLPLAQKLPEVSAWPGAGATPRARAEPRLETWVASIFGPPENIVATANYTRPDDSAPSASRQFTLQELGLSALDVLMLAPGEAPGAGEFGARVQWALLNDRPARMPENCTVELDGEWNASLAAHEIPLNDFLMLARTLRPSSG